MAAKCNQRRGGVDLRLDHFIRIGIAMKNVLALQGMATDMWAAEKSVESLVWLAQAHRCENAPNSDSHVSRINQPNISRAAALTPKPQPRCEQACPRFSLKVQWLVVPIAAETARRFTVAGWLAWAGRSGCWPAQPKRIYIALRLTAFEPLPMRSGSMSNDTFWPSASVRKPDASSAETMAFRQITRRSLPVTRKAGC
jgi:hypothetical protein